MFRYFREKTGLTQEQVSEKLNIDKSTVSKWETGISKPTVDLLIKVSQLYNCSIDDLINFNTKEGKNECANLARTAIN